MKSAFGQSTHNRSLSEYRNCDTGQALYNYCPKGLLCRSIEKIDVCASVRAVRASARPRVRAHQNGPDLVTRYWVLELVTPSSATNSGSVRDASRFSDKTLGFGVGNEIECH